MILNINFINLLNTVITSDKHKFLKGIIAQSTSVGLTSAVTINMIITYENKAYKESA